MKKLAILLLAFTIFLYYPSFAAGPIVSGPVQGGGGGGGIGPQGPQGIQGPAGANGTNGADGTDGIDGTDGCTVLYGAAAPTIEGKNCDFYIRTTTNYIYGPKAGGVWPAGTSLVGPQGIPGTVADVDDLPGDTIDDNKIDFALIAIASTDLLPSDEIVAGDGTVDAITANYTIDKTLADKTIARFRSAGANTSATPSFAPDGLTAHTIVKHGGVALVAGDIGAAGFVAILQYDLANTRWELLNPVYPPGMSPRDTTGGYWFIQEGTGGGDNMRKWAVPDALTADLTFLYPDALPTAGQVMSWGEPAAGISTGAFITPATLTGSETLTNKTLTAPYTTLPNVFIDCAGAADPYSYCTGANASTLTATQVSGTIINTYGRGEAQTVTLPTAAAGYNFLAIVGTQHNSAFQILSGSANVYGDIGGGTLVSGKTYFQETNQPVGCQVACYTFQTGASAWSWKCNGSSSTTCTWATD